MLEKVSKIKSAFTDERGEIKNILEKPINHVAIITSKAGSIRGNHYHPNDTQYCYLIKGKFESHAKDVNNYNSNKEIQIIENGDLVITPPNIAHAMKFLEDSTFLALTLDHRENIRFSEHTIKIDLL